MKLAPPSSYKVNFVLLHSVSRLLVRAKVVPSSYVPPKRLFLQEPHGVTSQKTQFFLVDSVKSSNLTKHPVSETLCFLLFKIPDVGRSPEPQ
jgi:hypothetical protein